MISSPNALTLATGCVLALVLGGCVNTPGKYQDAKAIFQTAPVSNSYFESSYAYVLYPTIGKVGVGVGGARGRGGVFVNDAIVGESAVTQLSAGLQFGGQAYSQIIFFEDERAYREFCNGTFEFGVNASAVAITAAATASASSSGASASKSTHSTDADVYAGYHKGAAVFTVAKGGAMYEASLSGQKFNSTCG